MLVFILLSLFLQVRLAFWVAMGLPVAIAGTFVVLGQFGLQYTINEVTTFGFILVLGILVDDAVVVGESIYSCKEKQGNGIQSAIDGVHKVAIPTIFGVLTTVAALLPMTQFPSENRALICRFLLGWLLLLYYFSLLESKFILPAHLRHIRLADDNTPSRIKQYWLAVRQLPQAALNCSNHRLYHPLLRFSLRYRYAWLMIFLAISFAVLASLYQGKIRTVLFPEVPGDLIIINVALEANPPLLLTQRAMALAEQN